MSHRGDCASHPPALRTPPPNSLGARRTRGGGEKGAGSVGALGAGLFLPRGGGQRPWPHCLFLFPEKARKEIFT